MKIELLGSMRMPNQSVRIMRAALDEAGINPLPLLADAGIAAAEADDPQGEVSGLQELRFQEVFATASLNTLLTPTLTVYKEIDRYKQWY